MIVWKISILFFGFWLIMISHSPMFAQEKRIVGDEKRVSVEEMYQRWAKHRPQDIIDHGRKAVLFLQKHGEKGYAGFNDPTSDTWWPNRPFFTPVMVMSCNDARVLTHPIAQFRKPFTQKGALKKFMDSRGSHTFFYLCKRLRGKPKGAWVTQYHFWPGVAGPIWMAVLGLPIPGTPNHVHLFYITKDPNVEMLDKLLD